MDRLQHAGIKGMRWGKRKAPTKTTTPKKDLAKTKAKGKEIVDKNGKAPVKEGLVKYNTKTSKGKKVKAVLKVIDALLFPDFPEY